MFFSILLICSSIFISVLGSGEFILQHIPKSITFEGNQEIYQSSLKEVYSAALGFTVKQQKTKWNGMVITEPFQLPEAVVAIVVEGVNSLELIKGKRFPLVVDEVEETTWQTLSGRLEERDNDNSLVRIYLGDGLDALGQSALGELKSTTDESTLKFLKAKDEADRKFLEEVQILNAIAKKVPTAVTTDDKPDVYWFVVSGLKPLYDFHGNKSEPAQEALNLLNDAITNVNKAFVEVYKGQVLFTVFTNDASQLRHTRSVIYRPKRDLTTDIGKSKVEATTEVSPSASNALENKPTLAPVKITKDTLEKLKKETSTEINDLYTTQEIDDYYTYTENFTTEIITTSLSYDLNVTDDSAYVVIDNLNDNMQAEDIKNLATKYSAAYPVMFNIFLWFTVAFFFALIAICVAIADMDPGRDSIIYRMTSNRMKKDN